MSTFKDNISAALTKIPDSRLRESFFHDEFGFNYLEEYNDEDTQDFYNAIKSLNCKDISSVKHHGGEGQGSDYYTVWKFVDQNDESIYVKFHGWYQSHYGSEYEGYVFVTPKEVTVVQYL